MPRRRTRYFKVRLREGYSHPNWAEWYEAMEGRLGAPAVDYASYNLRVVKTTMTAEELLRFCSRAADGGSFAEDVEVREITRKNARDPEVAGCISTIQNFYKGFKGLVLE